MVSVMLRNSYSYTHTLLYIAVNKADYLTCSTESQKFGELAKLQELHMYNTNLDASPAGEQSAGGMVTAGHGSSACKIHKVSVHVFFNACSTPLPNITQAGAHASFAGLSGDLGL